MYTFILPQKLVATKNEHYYLGNASKNQVCFVSGNATRTPDVSAECSTTPATFTRDARSTVGTVPMLCP